MTGRKLLFSLALGVLVGTFAGVAIADTQGMDSYGPWDRSLSAEPERSVGQPEEGESREPMETRGPMETGLVPDPSESSGPSGSSSDLICCADSGDPTFRPGGP